MAISIDWVPGFERHPHPSVVGDYTGGPTKLIIHTFEGDPGKMDAAVNLLMGRDSGIYHILIDLNEQRIVQLMPLNKACSALVNGPDPVETNKDSAIQICIVDRAKNMPDLSEDKLQFFGENVIATLKTYVPDINLDHVLQFFGEGAGFIVAAVDAPQRLSIADWDNFDGVCGHQHVPDGNDHWDPGGLNVLRAVNYAKTKLQNQGTVIGVGAPLGNIDVTTPLGNGQIHISGWAFDPDKSADSIDVHIYINGMFAAATHAGNSRSDINQVFNIAGDHGFDCIVNIPFKVTIDAYAISQGNPLIKRVENLVVTV